LTRAYYSIGAGIRAKFTDASVTPANVIVMNMPGPQPTTSGFCDFTKPVRFLTESDNFCTAFMDLNSATDCEGGKFNTAYFFSGTGDVKIEMLTNANSTSQGISSITVDPNHYVLAADGTYTEVVGAPPATAYAAAGATCTCSNHIKQVHYDISYEAREDNYLHPASATVQFVIGDTTAACTSVQEIS